MCTVVTAPIPRGAQQRKSDNDRPAANVTTIRMLAADYNRMMHARRRALPRPICTLLSLRHNGPSTQSSLNCSPLDRYEFDIANPHCSALLVAQTQRHNQQVNTNCRAEASALSCTLELDALPFPGFSLIMVVTRMIIQRKNFFAMPAGGACTQAASWRGSPAAIGACDLHPHHRRPTWRRTLVAGLSSTQVCSDAAGYVDALAYLVVAGCPSGCRASAAFGL